MSSKHMKYSAKFKLQVVKFTQESNNFEAGCEFCINEKLWNESACQRTNLAAAGNSCQWTELEDKLLLLIEVQKQSGYIIARNMIIIKAKACNGCWIADNWFPGFQLLVYDVPLKEESCSLTEDKDRPDKIDSGWRMLVKPCGITEMSVFVWRTACFTELMRWAWKESHTRRLFFLRRPPGHDRHTFSTHGFRFVHPCPQMTVYEDSSGKFSFGKVLHLKITICFSFIPSARHTSVQLCWPPFTKQRVSLKCFVRCQWTQNQWGLGFVDQTGSNYKRKTLAQMLCSMSTDKKSVGSSFCRLGWLKLQNKDPRSNALFDVNRHDQNQWGLRFVDQASSNYTRKTLAQMLCLMSTTRNQWAFIL